MLGFKALYEHKIDYFVLESYLTKKYCTKEKVLQSIKFSQHENVSQLPVNAC